MIEFPAFKDHLHVEIIPGEGVLILSEDTVRALHGAAYEKIVPLIDGRRSADEIVVALADQIDAAVAYYVLQKLESKGHLTEAHPEIPRSAAAFWHAAGIDPVAAHAGLRDKRVAVRALGEVKESTMQTALSSSGVSIGTWDDADLWLVLTDDYLRTELAAINAAALQANRPWFLIRVTGRELWMGPLFQPGQTGCWECLRVRLDRNRAVHRFVAGKKGLATPPHTALGALPATEIAACHMAVALTAQILGGATQNMAGQILCVDWPTLASQSHRLLRHPHCSACGKKAEPEMKPVTLQPVKATFLRDSGHRSVPPEQTLKKYEHLVGPLTGVVRVLMPAHENVGLSHVYLAGHNPVKRLERLDHLKKDLRHCASGKGASETQAKASALCEALERYSGELMGGEIRITRAWRDWKNGEALHPNDVMRFSSRQFSGREAWNEKASHFNEVPNPLADDTPIDWTPLWSLTEQRHKHLPTQLVYFGAPARDGDQTRYAIGCSNGNASGNTLEEAILQGFFEVVERDAVALWWYNRLRKPGVALDSFDDSFVSGIAEFYREHYHRDAWALDLTSDLGLPVFVAVSKARNAAEERILFGMGCHLEARIALQRAFGEMNQMMGLAHAGQNGELSLEDAATLQWLRHATVANQPYVAPDPDQPARRAVDYPVQHSGDFLQDIQHCRGLVESMGLEMLVLDQTRADVEMPVVKVVVPGMRHFWARYAPGRLYDVPVKMGWLKKPQLEEELNPIPVFF